MFVKLTMSDEEYGEAEEDVQNRSDGSDQEQEPDEKEEEMTDEAEKLLIQSKQRFTKIMQAVQKMIHVHNKHKDLKMADTHTFDSVVNKLTDHVVNSLSELQATLAKDIETYHSFKEMLDGIEKTDTIVIDGPLGKEITKKMKQKHAHITSASLHISNMSPTHALIITSNIFQPEFKKVHTTSHVRENVLIVVPPAGREEITVSTNNFGKLAKYINALKLCSFENGGVIECAIESYVDVMSEPDNSKERRVNGVLVDVHVPKGSALSHTLDIIGTLDDDYLTDLCTVFDVPAMFSDLCSNKPTSVPMWFWAALQQAVANAVKQFVPAHANETELFTLYREDETSGVFVRADVKYV